MRTLTFTLSKPQQIIISVVMTLALLFAGCSEGDNPVDPDPDKDKGINITGPTQSLEGSWIDIKSQLRGINTLTHHLTFDGTQGVYRIEDASASADDCKGYSRLSRVFNYEITSSNTLRLEILHNAVCGVEQGQSEETVFYTLFNDNLRIFNRTFQRRETERQ